MAKSAEEKRRRCWSMVLANAATREKTKKLEWPSFPKVWQHIANTDSMAKLWTLEDLTRDNRLLCAHGCACLVRLNWFPTLSERYSGLFANGSVEGIMRLASAIEPPAQFTKGSYLSAPVLWAAGKKLKGAVLFPTVAIKVFRDGESPSGNLLFMGSKVGQREKSFFAHSVSTEGTEKASLTMRPILNQFRTHSKYPLSAGISNFAAVEGEPPRFPWALALVPRVASEAGSTAPDVGVTSAAFITELLAVQPGTVLYDIFACPSPAAAVHAGLLERVGYVTTLSEMTPSSTPAAKCPLSNSAPPEAKESAGGGPSNPSGCPSIPRSKGRLFFQHQKKEEDYDHRPEWVSQLKAKCCVREPNGKNVTGTVGYLSGWKLFERHVTTGKFIDLEKL